MPVAAMRTYEPTPLDPAAFDAMVAPSTAESLIGGAIDAVGGVVQGVREQKRLNAEQQSRVQMASALREAYIAQGLDQFSARVIAMEYFHKGTTELQKALLDVPKSLADIGYRQAQTASENATAAKTGAEAAAIPETTAADVGLKGAQAGLAGAQAAAEPVKAKADLITAGAASKSADTEAFREKYLVKLGRGNKGDLMGESLKQEIMKDFQVTPQERAKMYMKTREAMIKEHQQKKEQMEGLDSSSAAILGGGVPELSTEEIEAEAEKRVDQEIQEMEAAGARYLGRNFGGGGAGDTTITAGGGRSPIAPPSPPSDTLPTHLQDQNVNPGNPETKAAVDEIKAMTGGGQLPPGITRELLIQAINQDYPNADVNAVLRELGL